MRLDSLIMKRLMNKILIQVQKKLQRYIINFESAAKKTFDADKTNEKN
jgi:hypothetical protein